MTPSWLTVLTTPLRTNYLHTTLHELDAAGAALGRAAGLLDTVVCVDRPPGRPYEPALPVGWRQILVGNGRGTRWAMAATIQAAAAAGAESLIYLEDDVLPCVRAVIGLLEIEVPEDCGFLVACDVRCLAGAHVSPPRLVTVAADDLSPGFWGSQALLLPRRALVALANVYVDPGDPNAPNASDVWIGDVLASKGAPWQRFAVLGPSLFQHIGQHSTINPGWTLEPHRVAASWRGDTDGQAVVRALSRIARAPF